MYEIDDISHLKWLFAIPLLLLAYILLLKWKQKKQKLFAHPKTMQILSPNISTSKQHLKIFIACLAILMLTLSLINPKIGTKLEALKRKGIDIVFALDVSKSMLAEDVAPSRLLKSKQLISKIIDRLINDRIGIIIYAGNSYPLLPITTDYGAAKMFLQTVDTDIIPSQGTDISGAIEMTRQYFDDQEVKNKVLIIISDGEDHGNNAISIAQQMAQEQNLKIYTVGMGMKKGGPIPIKKDDVITSYKKDNKGEVVITQLNDQILKEIATATGGKYIQANNIENIVHFIEKSIQKMDKQEYESKVFSEYKSQFQWFLGIAIFLLILDVLILERKTQWLKRFKLFQ